MIFSNEILLLRNLGNIADNVKLNILLNQIQHGIY
jgi:hypothetical protein